MYYSILHKKGNQNNKFYVQLSINISIIHVLNTFIPIGYVFRTTS